MKKFNVFLLFLAGTFILSLIGLYNGYPLVYSDTGTYIYSGFDHFIPKDRPVAYGMFIYLFSLKFSLWFVIIVQNFLTVLVLYEVLCTLGLSGKRMAYIFLTVITFLVFFTGIGWYTNQIMPDFLAPLSILIIFILLKKPNISVFTSVIMSVLLVFSLVSHFTHMMIGSLLILILIILKYSWKKYFHDISLRRLILVGALVFSSWLILPTINYMVEKSFILSKGSHVFLMGHLVDTGILEKFLKEKCGESEFKDNPLCAYKDVLPTGLAEFIWSDSILEKTGGWDDSREAYKQVIHGSLKDPKFLFLNIFKSVTYGFVQLTQNEIGQGLTAYNEGSAPYGQIHWRFHSELNNYLNSRQNKWNGANLQFKTLNTFYNVLLYLVVFILIYLFTSPIFSGINPDTVMFLLIFLLGIILNAFISAGLNLPCSSFEARVTWLLPFALIILGLRNYRFIRESWKEGL